MAKQEIPKLQYVKFGMGYQCDKDCGFCLQQERSQDVSLSCEVVEAVLDDDEAMKDINLLVFTGGEPTFYWDNLISFIPLCRARAPQVGIFSHGGLLDKQRIRTLKEKGLTWLRVSLYDPIDWQHTENLMELCDEYGFERRLKYLVTKQNVSGLEKVLKHVGELQPHLLDIKPFTLTGIPEVDREYEVPPQEIKKMTETITTFKNRSMGTKAVMLPQCYDFVYANVELDGLSPCRCGRDYCSVDPNGDVKVCSAYKEPLGNVLKTSLSAIWTKAPLLQQVRAFADRSRSSECQDCNHWDACAKTDCHSITYNKYGDFEHGNPQCPKTRMGDW